VCLGFDVADEFDPNDQTVQKENMVGNPFYVETDPSGVWLISMKWHGASHGYRSIKAGWTGRPSWKPDALLNADNPANTLRFHFSWNGATEVVEWRVMRGVNHDDISEYVETIPRTQFEHWVDISDEDGRLRCVHYQAVAVGKDGKDMAYSNVVPSWGCSGQAGQQ